MNEIDYDEILASIKEGQEVIELIRDMIKDLKSGTTVEKMFSYNLIESIRGSLKLHLNTNSLAATTGLIMHDPSLKEDCVAQKWLDNPKHPIFDYPEDKATRDSAISLSQFIKSITGDDSPPDTIDNTHLH